MASPFGSITGTEKPARISDSSAPFSPSLKSGSVYMSATIHGFLKATASAAALASDLHLADAVYITLRQVVNDERFQEALGGMQQIQCRAIRLCAFTG